MNKLNKKGFTLVELVVTIAILLALSTIAILSVTGVFNRSNDRIDEIQEKLIMQAARAYALENGITTDSSVTIEELYNEGFLEEYNEAYEDKEIKIEVDSNGKYTYDMIESSDETSNNQSGEQANEL